MAQALGVASRSRGMPKGNADLSAFPVRARTARHFQRRKPLKMRRSGNRFFASRAENGQEAHFSASPKVAAASGLAREVLCKALRAAAQPHLDTVGRVCGALGGKLVVQPVSERDGLARPLVLQRTDVNGITRTRVRLIRRLDRAATGNLGDVRSVGRGVFEMREHFGPGWRMSYVQTGMTLIVMLGGGDKSTQSRDIANAIELSETIEH